MVKIRENDEIVHTSLKVRVRFDYKGVARPSRFFFGGKTIEQVAEETREHKVALLRNVPIQGVQIEDIDVSTDVYTVFDDFKGEGVAYAPVLVTIKAETIEDVIHFIARDEFRKVEIIEPEHMYLSKFDVERLLFKMNEELRAYRMDMERRAELR